MKSSGKFEYRDGRRAAYEIQGTSSGMYVAHYVVVNDPRPRNPSSAIDFGVMQDFNPRLNRLNTLLLGVFFAPVFERNNIFQTHRNKLSQDTSQKLIGRTVLALQQIALEKASPDLTEERIKTVRGCLRNLVAGSLIGRFNLLEEPQLPDLVTSFIDSPANKRSSQTELPTNIVWQAIVPNGHSSSVDGLVK